jgi:hypothetical protein
MGSWGEGPFDSDNALDWLDMTGIEAVVARHCTDALNAQVTGDSHQTYDIIRAAAHLLTMVGAGEMQVPLLHLAVQRLQEIRADDSYVNEWADPAKFLDALDQQLADLGEALASMNVEEDDPEAFPGPDPVPEQPSTTRPAPTGRPVPEGESREHPGHRWDPEHERWVPR